ncbi:MAG TPA: acyl-CoA dehydrogenase, partial [Planctomycetes bacterium]|nr:acyl-CoA dehydrogenase [Planctomycetota bacterium]
MTDQLDSGSTSDETQIGESFAETALRLGGKSDEEARRTGAIDLADDQVESLFQPKYQTANSPVHQAVWDRGVPIEQFTSSPVSCPPDVQSVMDNSLEIVKRHRAAGTILDDQRKICDEVLSDLGDVGYWGLLVDQEYSGSGSPFSAF